jgi:hypothetical protein
MLKKEGISPSSFIWLRPFLSGLLTRGDAIYETRQYAL